MASVAENNNAAPQRGENSDQGNAVNSIPTTKDEVKEVHVDGLVVLQIIQHIESTLPALGKGCLLGLGENNILEVTHSFGTPLEPQSLDEKKEAHENGDLFGEDYEREMMKLLRDVNVDSNCVGWFKACELGSFIDRDGALISEMLSYQEEFPLSVLFLYDPHRTRSGHLSLKALRLKNQFVQDYANKKKFTRGIVNAEGKSEIFVEIPIVMKNANVVKAFLWDLKDTQGDELDTDFDRFDLSTNPFLERNLEFLIKSVDELGREQRYIDERQVRVQRALAAFNRSKIKRAKENEARLAAGQPLQPVEDPDFRWPNPPSRLGSMLVATQINEYCDQINRFNGQGFSKLFLAGSLRKDG